MKTVQVETVVGLEPAVLGGESGPTFRTHDAPALYSIAISLKRIADALTDEKMIRRLVDAIRDDGGINF